MTAIIVTDSVLVPVGQEDNPCVGCGACCAFFRAAFHSLECASIGGTVPDETVEQVTPHLVVMKGTYSPNPRCINLTGEIGKNAFCSGYATRSSTCSDGFPGSYQFGEHNDRCDRARAKHGLRALTQADWPNFKP
jgi:Fe-S-cluster containining protein